MLRYLTALAIALLPLTASAEGKFFDSDGVQIHYYDRGSGEPVVLIHGLTSSATRWETLGITDALTEAGYRVIAFDARGHGKSGKPHDPARYGMEMSEDITRLLDHLNISQANVVGYSMGAGLTNRFRATHPDRLLTAVLGGGGFISEERAWAKFADSIAQGDVGPMLRRLTPPGQPQPSQEQIDTMNREFFARNDKQALAAVLRSSWEVDSVDELRSNKVPTLALVGELDAVKKEVGVMAAVMANLEVVVIPGADHPGGLRDPLFLEETLKFLAKHRKTASEN